MAHMDTLTTLNGQEAVRQYPLSIFLGLVAFVGLIGNLVVFYIYTNVYKNSNSRCFIRWLAAVDMVTCIVAIPLDIYTIQNQYQFDEPEVCKAARFMNAFGTTTSAMILVLIAIDRHRKICHPFEWQISNDIAKIFCLITFICGTGLSLPIAFIYGIKSNDIQIRNLTLTGTECSVADSFKGTKYALIYNTIATMIFILCAVTFVTLYILLGRKVRFFAKKREERNYSLSVVSDPSTSNTQNNMKRKLSELNGNILNSIDRIEPCVKNEDVLNDTLKNQYQFQSTETIETTAHSSTYNNQDGLSSKQPSYAVEDTAPIISVENIRSKVTVHTTHDVTLSGDDAIKESTNSSVPTEVAKESTYSFAPTEVTKESTNSSAPTEVTKESTNSSAPTEVTKESANSSAPTEVTKESANSSAPTEVTKESTNSSAPTEVTKESTDSSAPTEAQTYTCSALVVNTESLFDTNDVTTEKFGNLQTEVEIMSLGATVASESSNSPTAPNEDASPREDVPSDNSVNHEIKICTNEETNETCKPDSKPTTEIDPCPSNSTVSIQESDSRPLYHADEMSTQIPVHRLSRINTIKSNVCRMVSFKKVHRVTISSKKSTKTLVNNTTFLMFIVTMVFLLIYLPYLILAISRELIDGFVDNMTIAGWTSFRFFIRFYFANAAVNPIIYSIFDRRFRIACQQTFNIFVNRVKCKE